MLSKLPCFFFLRDMERERLAKMGNNRWWWWGTDFILNQKAEEATSPGYMTAVIKEVSIQMKRRIQHPRYKGVHKSTSSRIRREYLCAIVPWSTPPCFALHSLSSSSPCRLIALVMIQGVRSSSNISNFSFLRFSALFLPDYISPSKLFWISLQVLQQKLQEKFLGFVHVSVPSDSVNWILDQNKSDKV